MAQAKKKETTEPKVVAKVELNGRKDPKVLLKDAANKSIAIRALSGAGYSHSEIVRISAHFPMLQYDDGRPIRYQHVRNVMTVQLKEVKT